MNFDFLDAPKSFFTSIYNKIEATALKTNMTVKEFLSKPGNRDHISLVVYDIFPLPIKLSLRYERFKKFFDQNYEKFVVKILSIKMASDSAVDTKVEVVKPTNTTKVKKTKIQNTDEAVKVKSKSIPVIMPSKKNGVALVK